MLIIGFTRFGQLDFNPTELMMGEVERYGQELEDCEIITHVLETEYEAAGRRICQLITSIDPDAVLGFGVAATSSDFRLERFAVNIDDSREPDNAGLSPVGLPIIRNGPPAYSSTLPLEHIFRALQDAGIPVSYSNHAGTYVCNHVFYLTCHQTATLQRERACGFIHVPLALGLPGLKPGYRSSPVNVITGVKACIATLHQFLAAKQGLAPQRGRAAV